MVDSLGKSLKKLDFALDWMLSWSMGSPMIQYFRDPVQKEGVKEQD